MAYNTLTSSEAWKYHIEVADGSVGSMMEQPLKILPHKIAAEFDSGGICEMT